MRIFPRPRPRESRRRRNDIEVIPDRVTGELREICHGDAWEKRREEVWERDGRRCKDCGTPVPLHDVKTKAGGLIEKACEIHHRRKRGMGGGKRDDRATNLVTLDWKCHEIRERFGEPEEQGDGQSENNQFPPH